MDEEIKKLLKENLKLTKEIAEMVKSVKRHITFVRIWTIIKILIILIPVVLGIIYLPPIIKILISQYGEFVKFLSDPGNISNINFEEVKSLINQQ